MAGNKKPTKKYRPKGVRLQHSSWNFIGAAVESINILGPDDLQYLWLPLSHVFGKALIACQLEYGFTSAVDGRIDRIVAGRRVRDGRRHTLGIIFHDAA